MAEAEDTTIASANDNRTMLQTITRLNENLTSLNDAMRAFMVVPADDLRPALERLVDDLIAALDAVSGDPDLEPEADEATLGALEGHVSHTGAWQLTLSDVADDQDDDASDFEPDNDREPSLGARERFSMEYGNQEDWGASAGNDREEDAGDAGEIEECYEPSLGSFDRLTNQAHAWRQQWVYGCGPETELDNADREGTETLLAECCDGLHAFDGGRS